MTRLDVCHMEPGNEQPIEPQGMLKGAVSWLRGKARDIIAPLASQKRPQPPLVDVNQRYDAQARRDFARDYYGLPEGF